MYEAFIDWVDAQLTGYNIFRGAWVDAPELYQQFICAVYGMGGETPVLDVQYPRYRVLLLGPRDDRSAVTRINVDLTTLTDNSFDGSVPCGAAFVQPYGAPTGPLYTTENRAWVSIDFRVIH